MQSCCSCYFDTIIVNRDKDSLEEAIKLEYLSNRLEKYNVYVEGKPRHPSSFKLPMLYLIYQLRSKETKTTYVHDSLFSLHTQSPETFTGDLLMETDAQVNNKVLKGVEQLEKGILKDLLFIIQGIDGQWISYDQRKDVHVISRGLKVSRSVKLIILRISELGWVYRKISAYLKSQQKHSLKEHSYIEQSFRESISADIRNYFKYISMMEAKLNSSQQTLTLRNFLVWSMEPLKRLKWICAMIEIPPHMRKLEDTNFESGNSRLLLLSKMKYHGAQFVSSLALSTEKASSRPILDMTKQLIFNSVLHDSSKEFFIKLTPYSSGQTDESKCYWDWKSKFTLVENRVPSLLMLDQAKEVLYIAKCINFLIDHFQDHSWVIETTNALYQKYQPDLLSSFEQLSKPIAELYKQLNSRVIGKIIVDCEFSLHVITMRRFIFMEQDDLITNIIASFDKVLNQFKTIQAHRLEPILEECLKTSSSSQWRPDIHDRCCIQVHNDGEYTGSPWDSIEFFYRTPQPLDVVINHEVKRKQQYIYSYLFKLLRCRRLLEDIWALLKILSKRDVDKRICHLFQISIYMWMRFFNNLRQYTSLDIITTASIQLSKELDSINSLDSLVDVYAQYIQNIYGKCHIKLDGKLVTIFLDDVYLLFQKYHISFTETVKENEEALSLVITKLWVLMKRADDEYRQKLQLINETLFKEM